MESVILRKFSLMLDLLKKYRKCPLICWFSYKQKVVKNLCYSISVDETDLMISSHVKMIFFNEKEIEKHYKSGMNVLRMNKHTFNLKQRWSELQRSTCSRWSYTDDRLCYPSVGNVAVLKFVLSHGNRKKNQEIKTDAFNFRTKKKTYLTICEWQVVYDFVTN